MGRHDTPRTLEQSEQLKRTMMNLQEIRIVEVQDKKTGQRKQYPLNDKYVAIGRSNRAAITLNDSKCSRQHAAIRANGDTVFVKDLGSSNGTFVNGRRLRARRKVQVKPGDVLVVATTLMSIRVLPVSQFTDASQNPDDNKDDIEDTIVLDEGEVQELLISIEQLAALGQINPDQITPPDQIPDEVTPDLDPEPVAPSTPPEAAAVTPPSPPLTYGDEFSAKPEGWTEVSEVNQGDTHDTPDILVEPLSEAEVVAELEPETASTATPEVAAAEASNAASASPATCDDDFSATPEESQEIDAGNDNNQPPLLPAPSDLEPAPAALSIADARLATRQKEIDLEECAVQTLSDLNHISQPTTHWIKLQQQAQKCASSTARFSRYQHWLDFLNAGFYRPDHAAVLQLDDQMLRPISGQWDLPEYARNGLVTWSKRCLRHTEALLLQHVPHLAEHKLAVALAPLAPDTLLITALSQAHYGDDWFAAITQVAHTEWLIAQVQAHMHHAPSTIQG